MSTPHTLFQARKHQVADCGCAVDVTPTGGLAVPYRLTYCPTHAAAPEMLEAWQAVFDLDLDDAIETYIPYPTKVRYRVALDKARTLLARIENGG